MAFTFVVGPISGRGIEISLPQFANCDCIVTIDLISTNSIIATNQDSPATNRGRKSSGEEGKGRNGREGGRR